MRRFPFRLGQDRGRRCIGHHKYKQGTVGRPEAELGVLFGIYQLPIREVARLLDYKPEQLFEDRENAMLSQVLVNLRMAGETPGLEGLAIRILGPLGLSMLAARQRVCKLALAALPADFEAALHRLSATHRCARASVGPN